MEDITPPKNSIMGNSRFGTVFTVLLVTAFLSIGWFVHSIAAPPKASSPHTTDKPARTPGAPAPIGHPSFMSPHASPIAVQEDRVFVVNTPSDTVDVIDAKSRKIVARIDVGIDPVSIAMRPDGKEVWVSNHISDSVSVIDTVTGSPTYLQVIATVQDLDPKARTTRFDEPVGVAFANNKKAYVALSSENRIAVVNVATRKVEKRLIIPAQDPRAIVVRGDRLYVIPFESNNKTQLSGGKKSELDGKLVTFDAQDELARSNNVLSLHIVSDIVKHPDVPDRDLFVFDTKTDELIETVDTLGTLLYGLAVDSRGRIFVAQTDARNDANGRAGTQKHGLAELENRAFLNRITRVDFDGETAKPEFFDLEPLPPNHPEPDEALATPFAIQVSDDDATLLVSAAGSDKVFTVDAASGEVLGRTGVDAGPRGIALESDAQGKASRAWVLNALANKVSLVDVSDPTALKTETAIALEDPSHPVFKRGRIAFNTAKASTTETFSCASCHPDGHTDQLLWVLKTPIVTGGDQIMPRSTMPVRGLRDTAPFHWDGIPGDPYGGNNSANLHGEDEPNADIDIPESASRHLIDGGLASTMLEEGDSTTNDEAKAGYLSAEERDAMAKFLLGIPYPPAPQRAYNNELSDRAEKGFEMFHIVGNDERKTRRNVCGNCHRMPFWVSTNTRGTGMEAPTWRGAYDRFLTLPQGRSNLIGLERYRHIAEEGNTEKKIWQRSWGRKPVFDPVWDMVLEGSTGFSGAFGRQVTLNRETAGEPLTGDLLSALESSAGESAVILEAGGAFIRDGKAESVSFQFDATFDGGSYVETAGRRRTFGREELVSFAAEGSFVGTFTGRHGANADADHPQPALWTLGPIEAQRGRQKFPVIFGEDRSMTISGRHIRDGASLLVDGRKVSGAIQLEEDEKVLISLEELPTVGLRFLQVQNPDGLFSNDFIFHVAENEAQATEIRNSTNPDVLREQLAKAIAEGDLGETRNLILSGAPINARSEADGRTPLYRAALHGHLDITRFLINRNARVSMGDKNGNTPLHTAAFFGRTELVTLLLEKGASRNSKNNRGKTPVDVVSGKWNEGLARIYRSADKSGDLGLDLDQIRKTRPKIATLLRDNTAPEK